MHRLTRMGSALACLKCFRIRKLRHFSAPDNDPRNGRRLHRSPTCNNCRGEPTDRQRRLHALSLLILKPDSVRKADESVLMCVVWSKLRWPGSSPFSFWVTCEDCGDCVCHSFRSWPSYVNWPKCSRCGKLCTFSTHPDVVHPICNRGIGNQLGGLSKDSCGERE
ncbi:hypothetical protein BKA81DRAFT_30258 [Phyllosticta paracitricarpa]